MAQTENRRNAVRLVVGIGEYLLADRIPALPFATHDAEEVADALVDPTVGNFPQDRVLLLTDENATRGALVQRLSKWLPEQARGAELVVIYFAGHGVVERAGRREEGFLLPYAADPEDVVSGGVAMSDLVRWIEGVEAGAIVVCLDCCHAGKVLPDAGTTLRALPRDLAIGPALLQEVAGKGRFLLTSCDEGQESVEAEELRHGLFTYHLLDGLFGAGDRDGDGRVGVSELFEHVAVAVERDAREQFGLTQKPWYSTVTSGGVYLSCPIARHTGPAELPAREGRAREEDLVATEATPDQRVTMLRRLRRAADTDAVGIIFQCLPDPSEAVRKEAKRALQEVGWARVATAAEELARRGEPPRVAAVLGGLAALEAHPDVVALLNRLVVILKGDLRNQAVLLLERKRLGLEREKTATLFRENQIPYQIRDVLGQGLFTSAYLARAEADDAEDPGVVVRVLRPEFADQPLLLLQFLDLNRLARRFKHENLVLTREVRRLPERNLYFVVRDFVPGATLRQVLEKGRPFTPLQVVSILSQLLAALASLQDHAAAHGGIKPSNVFLCAGDRVVLGDPSLPAQCVTVARERLSYDYRYAGLEAPGLTADLYALGCVAYELACGRPPFASDDYRELIVMHARDVIPPPREHGSRLGDEGDAFILRLLARSPADRFGSVEEALIALDVVWRSLLRQSQSGPPLDLPPVRLLGLASLVRLNTPQSLVPLEGQDFAAEATTASVPPSVAPLAAPPSNLSAIPAADVAEESAPEPSPRDVAGRPESGELRGMFGRYYIRNKIGEGGMGTVYRADDTTLKRRVALKVPHFRPEDNLAIERFYREAQVAANTAHPHICPVYDLGQIDGIHYFTMPYIEGESLAAQIDPDRPWDTDRAAALVGKLARAMAEMHHQGVVHRDLKPGNIMMRRNDEPVLLDFGLARSVNTGAQPLTQVGSPMGTPLYMSPEQVEGDSSRVGPLSDIYSLGVVLYQLLTGRLPFEGTSLAVFVQVLHNEPPRPSLLRPSVDARLEAVCLKAMAKEPEQRFASMDDFAGALADYLSGRPNPAATAGQNLLVPLDRIRFQFVGFGDSAPAQAAQRDRLFLDVGNDLRAGVIDHHHQMALSGSTASLVLHRSELVAGAVNPRRRPDDPFTLVLHEQPDIDGLAAAFLSVAYLTTGSFPPGSEALARYVDKVDEGSLGMTLANPFSLYAAFKTLSNRLLGRSWSSNQERWQESVRLGLTVVEFVTAAVADRGAAVTEVDAFECPGLFGPEDRADVLKDVDRYHAKLKDPRCRARRARLRLPGQLGGTVEVESLRVRDVQNADDPSRCVFFKDWARSDAKHCPNGKGFAALSVFMSEGSGHLRRCILSVAPDSGASLCGLGQVLDEAEAEKRRQVFGVDDRVTDPSTGEAKVPRPGYGNADPWYDGRAQAYTIVDAPHGGTFLTADEIETLLLRFGGHG